MKLLLDTHSLLWWLDNPLSLREEARLAIANSHNSVYVSAVSLLEIRIKQALGKLECPARLMEQIVECRFSSLPLSLQHADAMGGLPWLHRDPFDRPWWRNAWKKNLPW